MPNVSTFIPAVSGRCATEQWLGSRLKIKNFQMYEFRLKRAVYQYIGQTVYTIPRVRDGPSARDPDICTK